MADNQSKKLGKLVVFITLFIFGWIIFEVIIKGFDVVSLQYGVDPKIFFMIFLVCEIFFDLGIVMMVFGSGVLKINLKNILKIDFQNVVFENKWVYSGFTINRIAAIVPPLYLLVMGWGKLPLGITILVIVEILIVIAIGFLPFEYRRFIKK